MLPLANITYPTALVDVQRVKENIRRMAQKAKKSRVIFRPHFKTHQSAAIGEYFREFGVEAITTSSLRMAQYFANHGWMDITVAFPVNLREIETINRLASRIRLHLLLESTAAVAFLSQHLRHPVQAWIKIDVGYGRTGIHWANTERVQQLAREMLRTSKINLQGLLTHAGHTYHAASRQEIAQIYQQSVERMNQLRDRLAEAGMPALRVSVGDTPGCSVVEKFGEVDEIRPGNFVFYDAMQMQLGACREEDIALAVACPVVAIHPERQQLVIYGGAVHLSKDYLEMPTGENFGLVAPLQGDGQSPKLLSLRYPRSTG